MHRTGARSRATRVATLLATVVAGGSCGGGSTQPTTCEGAATEACAIEHGAGERSRTCAAGAWSDWGACERRSCDPGYAPIGEHACGQACLEGVAGTWVGATIEPQAGRFQVELDVTPPEGALEAAVALAQGTEPERGWTGLAAIVRFRGGLIDARDGDEYAAETLPYAPGTAHRVRLEIDVPGHTYSVHVTPPGGGEAELGRGYAFRTEQQAVANLDRWGVMSDAGGSLEACLVGVTPEEPAVEVTVTPASASLGPGETQAFSAAVTGTTNLAVTWTVDEASGCGTVTDAGLYTAPASPATCHVRATSVADVTRSGSATVEVTASPGGDYPFQGYTSTRGAFQALEDGQPAPVVLIVDSLASGSAGDETTRRGTLGWALSRPYPRVILFEVSGTIDVGSTLSVSAPYVSVHGQSAPAPGVTLYNLELLVRTHDVILQHLRVRMGANEIGGGDAISVCGSSGGTHDVIIDHCSAELGHDEQLSVSGCGAGAVSRVTLSNNLIALGLTTHNYGTLIDSGDGNTYGVDEILLDGNLWSQVSFRTPLINPAVRTITVTNNIAYNTEWNGMQLETEQYAEGMSLDYMHNLYWRGPRTQNTGTWPCDEVSTWPSQPELWPWAVERRPTARFLGPATPQNTHVHYLNNYQYVNGDDYTDGAHEGRPIALANERYEAPLTVAAIEHTSRVTPVAVVLRTPLELEQALATVGAWKHRDAVDALAIDTALARGGDWVLVEGDLGVPPVPAGSATRAVAGIPGYPAGHELDDADGDGLTDLEEWIYGL